LRPSIAQINPELASYIDASGDSIEEIQLAVEELESQKHRLLLVIDGFDHVLRDTRITRNLWDQLRDLGQRPNVVFVTGSRASLQQTLKPDEAQTSPFWNMFNPMPIVVGAFDRDDLNACCDLLAERGVTATTPARAEVTNWTGGVPLLAAALLRQIAETTVPGGDADRVDVEAAAAFILENARDLVHDLFSDSAFTLEMKQTLAELANRPLLASHVSERITKDLVLRGFVGVSGGRLGFASRIIERYVKSEFGELEVLRQHFGQESDFLENARTVLQLRLTQSTYGDQTLKVAVERAIRELPDLEGTLIQMRRVADRALDLIWEAELSDGRTFPNDWVVDWNDKREFCPYDGRVPSERGLQARTLEVMTGTGKVMRKSRFITKPTAMLVSYLHSVGDFGQHQQLPIRPGAVIASCWAAVELYHSLAADLHTMS
jgi:hypothetical protein